MNPNCEADSCRRRAVRSLIWRGETTRLAVCQNHAAAGKRLYGDGVLVMYL